MKLYTCIKEIPKDIGLAPDRTNFIFGSCGHLQDTDVYLPILNDRYFIVEGVGNDLIKIENFKGFQNKERIIIIKKSELKDYFIDVEEYRDRQIDKILL